MKKKYKIYQCNATIQVQDKKGSWYDHEVMERFDDEEYDSETDAESVLKLHLSINKSGDEYVILPVYSSK